MNKSYIYVVRYNSIIKCTMDTVVVAASIEDAPRVAGIENSSSLVSVERVGVSDDPAERVLAQEEP